MVDFHVGIETWQDLYAPKPVGGTGAASSVFMTEISTSIGAPSTLKKQGTTAMRDNAKKLPALLNNFNSTAQLSKNFLFPSIKKSASLMNLRALVCKSII